MININNKVFISNQCEHSDFHDTLFYFNQTGNIIQGTYQGGSFKYGTLIGLQERLYENFHFCYNHINFENANNGGTCTFRTSILPNGSIRLIGEWIIDETKTMNIELIELASRRISTS